MIARAVVIAIAAASMALAGAERASAQALGPGRIELAIGPQWTGGANYGARDATETQASGSQLHLFSTSTELAAAPGLEARVAVRLRQRLDAEAVGTYARPQLRVALTRDAEGATDTTAAEATQLFSVSGGAVWALRDTRADARTLPIVTAGAGWVRELHQGDTLIVGGAQVYAGAGVKQLLRVRDTRRLKAIGVRADGRAIVRTKAIAEDGRTHAGLALTASLFVRF